MHSLLSHRKLLFFGFIVLIIAIVFTTLLLRQTTQSRSHAQASTTLSFSPSTTQNAPLAKNQNDSFTVNVQVDPGQNVVSSIILDIKYDPAVLTVDMANGGFTPIFYQSGVGNSIMNERQGPTYTNGKISVALDVGSDFTKAITQPVNIASIHFTAIGNTPVSPMQLTIDPSTAVVYSVGSNDSSQENVLSTTKPLYLQVGPLTQACFTSPQATTLNHPTDLVQVGGQIWASGDFGNGISRINAADGTALSSITEPANVATTALGLVNGQVWALNVVETNNVVTSTNIQIYNSDGTPNGSPIPGGTNFDIGSTGLAQIGSEVWITDYMADTIVRLHTDGTLAGTITGNGIRGPRSITYATQQAWIVNSGATVGSGFLLRFTAQGALVGSAITGNGLDDPQRITPIGSTGQVWVTDSGAHTGQSTTPSVERFNGSDGSSAGTPLSLNQFTYPAGILSVGSDVWISDSSVANNTQSKIILFQQNGTVKTCPSVTPTSTITPTATPTTTSSPTPTRTPTLTPSPTLSVPHTTINIQALLHGIGGGGDNVSASASASNKTPQTTTRTMDYEIVDNQQQIAQQGSFTVTYNPGSEYYEGSFALPNLPSANYLVNLLTPNYLKRQIPGIQNLVLGQTYTYRPIFVAGDVNNDNQIDIRDYNAILTCFHTTGLPPGLGACKPSDLNDNGNVEFTDINLFVREISVQVGNL